MSVLFVGPFRQGGRVGRVVVLAGWSSWQGGQVGGVAVLVR